MVDLSHYEQKLKKRQSELDVRLHRIEDDLDAHPNPDSEERATERENDEVLEELGLQGQAELKAIEAALERIAKGTFGVCVRCGEDISEDRLEAVPHAALCRDCMTK